MKELEFTTGLHRTTIHQHLDVLVDAGVVEVVEFPVGERQNGRPNKFYGITETARELFDRNNVFLEGHWRELYERVDKPGEIKEAEAAPRPDR
jgi:predicted ArsR family transcriptional regulator